MAGYVSTCTAASPATEQPQIRVEGAAAYSGWRWS